MELSGQILVKAYHTINLAADPSQASANHPETHLEAESAQEALECKPRIQSSCPVWSQILIRAILRPL